MTTDEALDAFYLNSVTIAGLVGKFGVKVREQANGTPHVRCDLVVKEHGFDDKIRTVYVAVCIFHGCLPPSPWEGCHSIHGKPATQST